MSILNDIALLIFRVVISAFMMFAHGLGKFNRLFSGEEIKFFDPFGLGPTFSLSLAVLSEFIAAGLIILGIITRLSSVTLIITMGVAAFIFHADDPFGSKEKALLFLASYVLLFLTGPGKFSLQSMIEKKTSYSNPFLKFILG
ncbi:MAG: DoxX family protein [Melioribacteraceae bacterium]|nr:DoxX family protein [Melioribacteraceae bacterium]